MAKSLMPKLNRMVADLGLGDRVHFLGQRGDVPRLMRAVDAMIHPSIDPEPFGRTLVEAMLADVPVIATDAGAASDILEAGKAGTLVPPGEPMRWPPLLPRSCRARLNWRASCTMPKRGRARITASIRCCRRFQT